VNAYLWVAPGDMGMGIITAFATIAQHTRSITSRQSFLFLTPKSSLNTNLLSFRYFASFFTEPSFQGSELQVYGQYGECIDLPEYWSENSLSMISSLKPALICCVFTALQCNTQSHAYTPVGASVSQLLGIYKDGGLKSFVCSCWVNEQSTCAPWVPLSPS
jgi:hypothetical protein